MNEETDLRIELQEYSSNFTEDEQKTYWKAIKQKSVPIGINIRELF